MRIRYVFSVVLIVLIAVLLGTHALAADAPLHVAIAPFAPPRMGEEMVGAWIVKTGTPATVQLVQGYTELESGLKSGKFDVVIGGCPGSTKKVTDLGLTIPESEMILYYGRLTMFLPPTNPRAILSARDLSRPNLKVGVCTSHAKGPLVDALKKNGAVTGDRLDPLLDTLQQDQLDVVIGIDTGAALRPKLVSIRIPQSSAGNGAAVAGRGYAARGTQRLGDVASLIQFCASSREARSIYLARGIMTGDGTHEEDYSKNAARRMMPSYISVAKQVATDYSAGATNCLDLGCGPGELTVEVAKAAENLEMTGLDIEPEGIDLAEQYTKEQEGSVARRLHWVAADVHSLPFPDNSFDIVMSRGSIFFWRDQATALREIMRVLRPGGVAFIGGGSGRFMSQEQAQMRRQPSPQDTAMRLMFPFPLDNIPALMARAGITDYRHISEGGTWIEFHKPAVAAKGE